MLITKPRAADFVWYNEERVFSKEGRGSKLSSVVYKIQVHQQIRVA